ncbi:hypothetical protein CLV84_1963 [Neolewinella xylanilytica]|uniref:Uncharacterized protein n=1 Tax=Neolewinella xylanilytica TaxID=1514080 RepID=A0A2S6I1L7_9BACT|nr:hypothetical protein CLV84_1963 [Neolewinella xylanilytica]
MYRLIAFALLALVACQKEVPVPEGEGTRPGGGETPTVCRILETYVNVPTGYTDTSKVEVDTLSHTYSDDGRLLFAELSGSGTVTFHYNQARIDSASYRYPTYGINFKGIYRYDEEGRLAEVRYPNWYTSLRKKESRLEIDSFYYATDGQPTGMSTWAEVSDHITEGYLPVVEREFRYDQGGNIDTIIAKEYYSTPNFGWVANTRVTARAGFTDHRNLLYESPERDFYIPSLSPYLHEREESMVTDPWGNSKGGHVAEFIFTPAYIIPEGYYTWSRPYICF